MYHCSLRCIRRFIKGWYMFFLLNCWEHKGSCIHLFRPHQTLLPLLYCGLLTVIDETIFHPLVSRPGLINGSNKMAGILSFWWHNIFSGVNCFAWCFGFDRILFLTVQSALVSISSGPWLNVKMSSYQYRKSHCGYKSVVRSSYFHNGISYTGKMASLYWATPPWSAFGTK